MILVRPLDDADDEVDWNGKIDRIANLTKEQIAMQGKESAKRHERL